ncbi:metallophosphoesterase [Flavimarina sp. Hel_I_48]|uniref:metallophosphoesterase n=1 Tax=Flavimarina sp. Hel_I_48 TaxID=1392488 RepID=UPI0004DEFCEB|nr:metallophosphoesterase [Flavimarina sp. Hel_I_48]
MLKNNILLTVFLALLFNSCATFEPQYKAGEIQKYFPSEKKIDKTFYLVGDAGLSNAGESTIALRTFSNYLKKNGAKGDYTIFLGDNIYPEGMPKKGEEYREISEHRLDVQYESTAGFEGETFIIPGNHDWYNQGLLGLIRQQDYLNNKFNDDEVFQPRNGCPLVAYDVNDNVHLIIIDTQWYLEDWNQNPTINQECSIKDRERFFMEIADEIKHNQQKTIVFAMHHPMYTNGVHGGKFAFSKHLYPSKSRFPLPGLASLVTEIRTQGGVSKQDRFNEKYNELMRRLKEIAGDKRIIFASGHEHTLQYIEHDDVHQIVSGAGSKESYSSLGYDGLFSYGGQGFAVLDVFKDGSSYVRYYGSQGNDEPNLLYEKEIFGPKLNTDSVAISKSFPKTVEAAVYDIGNKKSTPLFESVWGKQYREVYGKEISAPVALLDTLYGGLEVVRPAGGRQTFALRLRDKEGRDYNMRALRKNAVEFLQTVALNENESARKELTESLPQDLMEDFYASSHPYGAFAIPKMSEAIGVLHTLPKLFYVPKQPALKEYSEKYGDQLYMIVERPAKEFDGELFNYPDDIESTDDLLEKLRDDEENVVDEESYIRARMFDMLIGDWDRDNDQWRWAEYKNKEGKDIFVPIPRDRDQVFTNFDGTVLGIVRTLFGAAKRFQLYGENLDDIKWFSNAGIKLDRAVVRNATREEWIKQAAYIKENLSDAIIDEAFNDLPIEVRSGPSIEEIKRKLKGRKENLITIANQFYDYFSNQQTITGTDKDDFFEITRSDNATRVKVWRIKKGKKADLMIDRIFKSDETRELWIYGLDDTDTFVVTGNGKNPIFTRIIGGHDNDTYDIRNGDKIKVYDHKSLPNTVAEKGVANFRFLDLYEYNTYDYRKQILRVNSLTPSLGYNPDEGLTLGASDIYTVNGFQRNPFSQQHRFGAEFSFATGGLDFNYKGEFASVYKTWNLLATARYTTADYTQNFFGYGNETLDDKDVLGMDYNRARMSRIEASVSLVKNSDYGSTFKGTLRFQGIDVDNNSGRFIETIGTIKQGKLMTFASAEATYEYHSADNILVPTRGMDFEINTGVTNGLDDTGKRFAFLDPSIGFYNSLSENRKLVLKSVFRSQFRFGDGYEFYQSAQLGQQSGLRGFRFDRFSGKKALAGSADLRYAFDSFRTRLFPLQIGVFGGYDLGRVWVPGDSSEKWHDSYGLGFWVNSREALSGTVNFFHADEGLRVSLGFGFNF